MLPALRSMTTMTILKDLLDQLLSSVDNANDLLGENMLCTSRREYFDESFKVSIVLPR